MREHWYHHRYKWRNRLLATGCVLLFFPLVAWSANSLPAIPAILVILAYLAITSLLLFALRRYTLEHRNGQ